MQQEIIAYWNATVTPPLSQARVTPKRLKLLKLRMKDHPDWATWTEGIDNIEGSLFCRGLTGWRCTLDSLAERVDLIVKAAEGKYEFRIGDAPRMESAARKLRQAHGGCSHEPRCQSESACVETIVWGLFEQGRREPRR
jgi:hypothetical protein